jgi:hypothetical protein
MKSPVVVSREYKVMLRAGKFGGTEKQLLGTARKLWNDFARVVEPIVFDVEGTLDTIDKPRQIVFLDSDACVQHLRGDAKRPDRVDRSQPRHENCVRISLTHVIEDLVIFEC